MAFNGDIDPQYRYNAKVQIRFLDALSGHPLEALEGGALYPKSWSERLGVQDYLTLGMDGLSSAMYEYEYYQISCTTVVVF